MPRWTSARVLALSISPGCAAEDGGAGSTTGTASTSADTGVAGSDTGMPDPTTTAMGDSGAATDPASSESDGGPSTSESSSSAMDETCSGSDGPRTYATDFPLDEDPISEGGAWSAIASPWLRVRTIGGVAKADAYVYGYDDNYAILSGFGPDVEITATVYIAGSAPFGEILLLARMAETETTLRGYEFLYDGDGSVQLMRWNGPNSDFSPIGGEGTSPGPLQDEDQIRMRIVGDTITIFHRRSPDDWVQIGETSDPTFADGQPGFAFFVRNEGQSIDNVGLRDYAVTEIRPEGP